MRSLVCFLIEVSQDLYLLVVCAAVFATQGPSFASRPPIPPVSLPQTVSPLQTADLRLALPVFAVPASLVVFLPPMVFQAKRAAVEAAAMGSAVAEMPNASTAWAFHSECRRLTGSRVAEKTCLSMSIKIPRRRREPTT